jgi:hypothetical protein
MDALGRLAAELRGEGGLLADALGDPPADAGPDLGTVAAGGPRSRGREEEVALIVEAIREGQLTHAGRTRLLGPADEDLALLGGDRLYALGLERLAALGDLDAVRVLADVIAASAAALAAGRDDVAEAAWAEGAHAVGHGGWSEERADALRRTAAAAAAASTR